MGRHRSIPVSTTTVTMRDTLCIREGEDSRAFVDGSCSGIACPTALSHKEAEAGIMPCRASKATAGLQI